MMCVRCSTWRMTGSVRMFWMLGSAIAFSRLAASSSSEMSPLLICTHPQLTDFSLHRRIVT